MASWPQRVHVKLQRGRRAGPGHEVIRLRYCGSSGAEPSARAWPLVPFSAQPDCLLIVYRMLHSSLATRSLFSSTPASREIKWDKCQWFPRQATNNSQTVKGTRLRPFSSTASLRGFKWDTHKCQWFQRQSGSSESIELKKELVKGPAALLRINGAVPLECDAETGARVL